MRGVYERARVYGLGHGRRGAKTSRQGEGKGLRGWRCKDLDCSEVVREGTGRRHVGGGNGRERGKVGAGKGVVSILGRECVKRGSIREREREGRGA